MSDRHKRFCAANPDLHATVQHYFPDFDYRRREGLDLNYASLSNVVGHQQRAMTCWWAVEKCAPLDLGLDFGSHRGLTPLCIHVDKWYDNQNEHPIYGGKIPTDIIADVSAAESLRAFSPSTFPCIVSSHSLEHMPGGDERIVELLCTWHGLLRQGGALVIVVPDHQRVNVWSADKDHKSAWGHDDFRPRVLHPLLQRTGAKLIDYDTLQNNYSFDVVIERTAA